MAQLGATNLRFSGTYCTCDTYGIYSRDKDTELGGAAVSRSAADATRLVVPTEKTVAFAQKAVHEIEKAGARFVLADRETKQVMEIDEKVFELVRQILIDLAQNRPVSVIPIHHELTTYEAADLLNVSRGFILKLLNEKKLNHKMVGTHRRIRLEELLAYRDAMRSESDKAMEDLSAASQELGLE
jgi:excisionase family DNA binding protein